MIANSGAPLPPGAGALIKVAGAVALAAVLWAQMSSRRRHAEDVAAHRPDFGRGFRTVVAAEVVVGVAGLITLRLIGAPWQANVAWIAAVVGAHFVALARVWRDFGVQVVGVLMVIAGIAGLAMAAAGAAVPWIPVVSGVASGFTLLAGSLVASSA